MGKFEKMLRKNLAENHCIRKNALEILAGGKKLESIEEKIFEGFAEIGFFKLYADAFSIDEKGILISGHGGEGKTQISNFFQRDIPARYKRLGQDDVYLFADNENEPALLQIPEDKGSSFQDIMELVSDGDEQFSPLTLWVHLTSSFNENQEDERVVIPEASKINALQVIGSAYPSLKIEKLLKERMTNVPFFNMRKPHGYETDESVPKITFPRSYEEYQENLRKRYEKDVTRTAKAIERLIAGKTSRFSF
ncbi:hypothetical protein J4402_02435 [Candidatus Pacearchaeota archaeon]|nr:hypothetical protein [Candidatus Pacearchaeota archaeon]